MQISLNLERWSRVWLSKPWTIRPVPGTSMIEVHGVKGYLTPGDLVYLFNLAAELPEGGSFLEVGSWLGLSSIVFANGLIANLNFQARIFCVDTWQGSPEHQGMREVQEGVLFEQFSRNIAGAQMDKLITAKRGASCQVAQAWTGPDLDMIFIDGDHSLASCYADIQHWFPRLKERGRMLGHDAEPGSDVEKAVRRYCEENGYVARVCPMPRSYYIWEIQRQPTETPYTLQIL